MSKCNSLRKSLSFRGALAGAGTVALAVLSVSAASAATKAPLPMPSIVEHSCMVCHGGMGENTIYPIVPRLAGQQVQYLEWQLKQFHKHTRADQNGQIYMWPVAQALTPADINTLAKYYSSQKPMHSETPARPEAAAGEKIFMNGIGANVPACMACHGPTAGGIGTFPRLAGQRYHYIIQQLKYFHKGERVNPIMQPIAAALTVPEMHDLAAYLSSLKN